MKIALQLIGVIVITSFVGCSAAADKSRTYNQPPSGSKPSTASVNQHALDQRLLEIVGEAEVSETPDDPQAAETAINQGANVNTRNELGDTPLLIAARNGRVRVLTLLLDRGADINARDGRGQTALMIAVGNVASGDGNNDLRIVELLIKSGADVNIKDNEGLTALSGSRIIGGSKDPLYIKVRQMLKKAGARE